jgi:hypothetical protein
MRIVFVLLIAVFLLVGCGDPKNTVIPQEMSKWDSELKDSIAKLSEADRNVFGAYLIRAKLGEVFGGGGIPNGMTIGQAIEAQKKWQAELAAKEAEEKALKEKVERERAEMRKTVDEALTVAVVDLYMRPSDWQSGRYQDQQIIELAIKNKGRKDISGINGSVRFINMFDKEVGSIGFSYEDGIRAGEMKTWTGARDFNQFIPEHKAIANLRGSKFRSVFEPAVIVFSDGTKLTLPE